jgi:hypothetical protein
LKMNEMQRRFLLTVLAIIVPFRALAQDACVHTLRSAGPLQVDVAPPGQYVDVCAEDASLCKTLTSGYPPTASTLAYFVLPDEWKEAKAKTRGFTRYLIAQLSESMSPDKLPGFKQYLHSQQGQVPDHTTLPSVLALRGRVPLGIVAETSDSISFGTVMKLESTSGSSQGFALASINSAIIVRDRVLSVYAFDEVKEVGAIESLKTLSASWLTCLRNSNRVGQ